MAPPITQIILIFFLTFTFLPSSSANPLTPPQSVCQLWFLVTSTAIVRDHVAISPHYNHSSPFIPGSPARDILSPGGRAMFLNYKCDPLFPLLKVLHWFSFIFSPESEIPSLARYALPAPIISPGVIALSFCFPVFYYILRSVLFCTHLRGTAQWS